MNKKRLSVVMAGAMLATSVAPVLAAETTGTEIAYDQLATFKSDILAKLAEKKISNYAIFAEANNVFVSEEIQKEIAGNATGEFSSAFGVKITGKDGRVKTDTTYKSAEVKTALADLKAGDKVEVYERETTEFKGQLLPGKGIEKSKLVESTYVASDFASGASGQDATTAQIKPANSAIVTSAPTYDTVNNVVTVTTQKHLNPTGTETKTFDFTVGSTRIDGRLPLDAKGNLLDFTKVSDVEAFEKFDSYYTGWEACEEAKDKGAKVVETYTLGEEKPDETKETLNVDDLYDGLALTARGTEIFADLRNSEKAAVKEGLAENAGMVRIGTVSTTATNGIYDFTVTYYKNAEKNIVEKTITVVSDDSDAINGLQKLLSSNSFKVGVVAGQNRYETAVNVSKQIGINKFADGKAKNDNNIVLVNGESLVDGLAAAPLASTKGCYDDSDDSVKISSPLLLTQSDKLPTETKEYIESLIKDLSSADKKNVVVHLVGGSSVLETSLVNELKEMGLTVERHGGDNREETSVAVAKVINPSKTIQRAFVVGANGEADAMSISAVASRTSAITPIIVAKAGGISDAGLDYLEEKEVNDLTIVGGTSVVSETEEAKINKALVTAKAMRIAGKNRIETNNAIIKEYYKGNAAGVVVVKDGISRKSDLIDALSAANYAAKNTAPIVLATTEVTDAQKNTLLAAKGSTTVTKLAQVGIGAEKTVLETLASLLGVKNN
ncbi:cell wall-binding repeat-containing protein [Peptacetobacter hiranonis]|uniref:cell wall-binding repeat-containing protein n=1 Tax=Peptacetobacter hiranonis TaxID=89152 RepID=UPI0022E6C856|nr:cell wall-binding repeat-containing protein [Peptacetobacter hiranonis]